MKKGRRLARAPLRLLLLPRPPGQPLLLQLHCTAPRPPVQHHLPSRHRPMNPAIPAPSPIIPLKPQQPAAPAARAEPSSRSPAPRGPQPALSAMHGEAPSTRGRPHTRSFPSACPCPALTSGHARLPASAGGASPPRCSPAGGRAPEPYALSSACPQRPHRLHVQSPLEERAWPVNNNSLSSPARRLLVPLHDDKLI